MEKKEYYSNLLENSESETVELSWDDINNALEPALNIPGTIPPPLTPEILKEADHYSILRNPKLSESLYEAGYIERYGSGTVRIMESYENSNVKPEWWVKAGRTYLFLPLLQVDIETSIIRLLEIREKVTSSDLVKELGISLNTARKYLKTLVNKGLLEMKGKTRGRYYTLKKGWVFILFYQLFYQCI